MDLANFLQHAALLLYEKRVVSHPSFVGLARYNLTADVNRYVALFGDWAKYECFHYVYPKEEWRDEAKHLKKALKDLHEKYPGLVNPIFYGTEAYEKDKTHILKTVLYELKNIFFHRPIAHHILWNALRANRSYAFQKLEHGLEDGYAGRPEVERTSAHQGHWAYGVALEKFYLCWYFESIYTLYFFKIDEETEDIYQVAACCKNDAKAEQINIIEELVKKHNCYSITGSGLSNPIKEQMEIGNLRTQCKRCMALPGSHTTHYLEAKKITEDWIYKLTLDELKTICEELTRRYGEKWQFSEYRPYFTRFD